MHQANLSRRSPAAPHGASPFAWPFALLAKVYKKSPSLLNTGLSSSATSATTNCLLAFFRNCMSARRLFLKQK